MHRLMKISVYALVLVLLAVSTSSSPTQVSAASVRYVIKGGYDGYDCLTPAKACGTIDGALYRAVAGDTIEVTAETYYGGGEQVVFINKDISLSGGWDQTFTNRTGRTTIDGQNTRQGIEIVQAARLDIEYFIIQNGSGTNNAGGIVNWGTLTIDNCIVQYTYNAGYMGVGILNFGPLTVARSTIRDYSGPGIDSEVGPLTITESTISNNAHGPGIWIYEQSASIVNSTISGNLNNYTSAGGGIFYVGVAGQSLTLRNVTITGNQAFNSGGGISMNNTDGGQILMANSILAGNTAPTGSDCSGSITSQGYNIIGETSGCTISSTVSDQLDVDPKIAPLTYNGGPTYTHRVIAGSPAIDGGNPGGCLGQPGNPLTIDQRGFARPLDGNGDGTPVCDVGAYEYDPSVIILSSFLPVVIR
jgi:hypothetical protein